MDQKSVEDGGASRKGGWSCAIFIIFVEVAERFAYYGLAGNLITYLMKGMGESMDTAAQNVNIWVGVSSIFPILGAFIADAYFGRFLTILLSTIIYFFGLVVLTISVSSVIPKHKQKVVFFTALYILAVGEGGHKPCVQTFAADQFDEQLPQQKIAKSSFFNWWYFGVAAAATASVFFVIYLQENVGWTWGSAVLAVTVGIALVLFLMGSKKYRRHGPPIGSPFTRVVQVLVAAARNRHITTTTPILYYHDIDDSSHTLAPTNRFRFLDKAAMIVENNNSRSVDGRRRNPWRLCSVKEVEEVKLVLGLIPVWLSCLMFSAVQAQSHTFFTKQGSTMIIGTAGSSFHIPPASFQGFQGLTILATAIAYDRIFVPIMRKFTGHPSGITMLQRIGFGLFLSIINMVVAGIVETARLKIAARTHGVMMMHIWWLLPQYMICGISDVFVVVGLQELFYDHVPEAMRSVGAAAHISIIGVGSFISSAIIAILQHITSMTTSSRRKWLSGTDLNTANLNYFYWVLAGLSAFNLCIYLCVAMRFHYKTHPILAS